MTHPADSAVVRRYARIEIAALARKVIYRLQRTPAMHLLDFEDRYKTAWDECCHCVQHGPDELYDSAFDHQTYWAIQEVLDSVPAHRTDLLYAFATDIDQGLYHLLQEDLREAAANRENRRLGFIAAWPA